MTGTKLEWQLPLRRWQWTVMIFAGLKVRLFRRAIEQRHIPRAVVIIGMTLSVIGAFVVALIVPSIGSRVQRWSLHDAARMLILMWAFVGPLTSGVDGSIDPEAFRPYPISVAELALGLLVAGIVGPAALVSILALALVSVPLVTNVLAIGVIGLSLLALLITCVAMSRCTSYLLSLFLGVSHRPSTNRALILLAVAVGLFAVAWGFLGVPGVEVLVPFERACWAPVDAWTDAADAAANGEWRAVLLDVFIGVALASALFIAWKALLGRVLVAQRTAYRKPGASATGLMVRARTADQAVAARTLLYARRDARQRTTWFTTLGIAFFLVLGPVFGGGRPSPDDVFAVAAIALFAVKPISNQFGDDGAAYWFHIQAAVDTKRDLFGRNIAAAAIVVPAIVGSALLLAVRAGDWGSLAPALGLAASVLGLSLGISNGVSVWFPERLPSQGTNAFALQPLGGCLSALLRVGLLLLVLVIASPVIVLVLQPALRMAAVATGPIYGAIMWYMITGFAARRLERSAAKILVAVE